MQCDQPPHRHNHRSRWALIFNRLCYLDYGHVYVCMRKMCPNFEMGIKDGRRLIFLLSCPKIWNAHRLNSIQWEKLNRNHTIWLAPTKKNDCISYQIETDLHVWTRRRKHQMRSVEQKLHQRDITTKWPNHMYISLCDSQEKEIENEMKWNEMN